MSESTVSRRRFFLLAGSLVSVPAFASFPMRLFSDEFDAGSRAFVDPSLGKVPVDLTGHAAVSNLISAQQQMLGCLQGLRRSTDFLLPKSLSAGLLAKVDAAIATVQANLEAVPKVVNIIATQGITGAAVEPLRRTEQMPNDLQAYLNELQGQVLRHQICQQHVPLEFLSEPDLATIEANMIPPASPVCVGQLLLAEAEGCINFAVGNPLIAWLIALLIAAIAAILIIKFSASLVKRSCVVATVNQPDLKTSDYQKVINGMQDDTTSHLTEDQRNKVAEELKDEIEALPASEVLTKGAKLAALKFAILHATP